MGIFKGKGPVRMIPVSMDIEITFIDYLKSTQLCWVYPSIHSWLGYDQIPRKRITEQNEKTSKLPFFVTLSHNY